MTQTTQDQVNQTAWAACDTFRGVVDAEDIEDRNRAKLDGVFRNIRAGGGAGEDAGGAGGGGVT